MKTPDLIRFPGTAGARFVMARQLRYSAGTYGVQFAAKRGEISFMAGTKVVIATDGLTIPL